MHIDRAYLEDTVVLELVAEGVTIVCRAWPSYNSTGLFPKREFQIDLAAGQATCPAGVGVTITPGKTALFPAERCEVCTLKAQCTSSKQGRSLSIHAQEALLQRLAQLPSSAEGRAQLRERVDVEHGLAHISQRQGNRAGYNGTRKNTYYLRITAAIQNLERAQRLAPSALPLAA